MLIVEKTGLLYILKLVPGILPVEITCMFYIGNHKKKSRESYTAQEIALNDYIWM